MADFVEERLDLGYDYGAVGGPQYSTLVVVLGSGHERRQRRWADSRGQWQIGSRNITRAKLDYLLDFFRARGGRVEGFRFRDWSDYEAIDEPLSDADGTPTAQLIKTYTSAGVDEVRTIHKPVAGTVSLSSGGAPVAIASVDTTTGVVTLTPLATAAITGIAQDASGTVTAIGHGYSTGETIWITGVGGMTQVNDQAYVITVVDPDTFTLGVDTTGYSAYTSGGVAEKYPQPGTALAWSGEFDVPVRFDADELRAEFLAHDGGSEAIYRLESLPVVELKI